MTSVRAAVVQAGSVLFDTAASPGKAERYVRDAASRGAELIVLPEAFLGGYPRGQGDGSTMAAVSTAVGVLGAAICWENCRPLFRQAMYAQGVQIWCIPTVDETPRATVHATGGDARAPAEQPAPA